MNRLLKIVLLALVTLAFGATALAQEPLPAPSAPGETRAAGVINLNGPADGGTITPNSAFSWQHVGAASYTVKFKVLVTGEIVKWKPQLVCALYCATTDRPDALFDAAFDSYLVKWSVKATVDGVVYKSPAWTASNNEVDFASPLYPYYNDSTPRDQFEYFSWSHGEVISSYKLVIRDADAGQTIFKANVNPNLHCFNSTPFDLCQWYFGGSNPMVQAVLEENRHYVWFVKSVGPTGETDKSGKFHFFTESDVN